jgi:hypothetical protein
MRLHPARDALSGKVKFRQVIEYDPVSAASAKPR